MIKFDKEFFNYIVFIFLYDNIIQLYIPLPSSISQWLGM